MYKTTQFSTHAPLHNGGRGVSDIGVTIIWIGADHSKRAILKTEPGDSEPGWGSSPQWSGPPLSPPRPWTNTKDHYNSTSATYRQKIVTWNLRWPVQWAPPCLRGPSRPDCPLSDLKVNNLFWVNIGGWWKSKSSNTTVATRPQFPGYPSVPPSGGTFSFLFSPCGKSSSLLSSRPGAPLGK